LTVAEQAGIWPTDWSSRLQNINNEMKDRLRTWLRNSCLFEFLQRARYTISQLPRRSSKSYITNVKAFEVQKNVVVETYRLGPPFGPCPAASVYIYDDEVMRFDCIGGSEGHFHVNLTQARFCPGGERSRFYFPEGSVARHIENAEFQLRRNFDYARRQNYRRRVRATQIDQAKLNDVAGQMKAELLRLDGIIAGTGSDFPSR
jgi:hypothetical protein